MSPKNGDSNAFLIFLLHAHLPFVRHNGNSILLEENWLFEAITETYIPLLYMLDNLAIDKIPFRLTISLSPPLCTMLSDNLLQDKYLEYISKLEELSQKELKRTKNTAGILENAKIYNKKFTHYKHLYEKVYNKNLLKEFSRHENNGNIEIITSSATHAFLPNIDRNSNAVKAQISIAIQSHEHFFGTKPKGIWIPECGYYNGLENILEKAGLNYFFLDTHGILFATPRPKYGTFSPLKCSNTNVVAFGRDSSSTREVWDAKQGYPGNSVYREFYRDIGFDLDLNYIGRYIDPAGIRINTGIKYYRITNSSKNKDIYDYSEAIEQANIDANDFIKNRNNQLKKVKKLKVPYPTIVAPYDAELFGHWWYEGPHWLDFVIRESALKNNEYILATPSDYLSRKINIQNSTPEFSSWGRNGYSEMWLSKSNDWIYKHLNKLETIMTNVARNYNKPTKLQIRILNQMARELLLAESSDWAFMMETGTTVEYAKNRFRNHINNFNKLYSNLKALNIDKEFLKKLELENNIFPNLSYKIYS